MKRRMTFLALMACAVVAEAEISSGIGHTSKAAGGAPAAPNDHAMYNPPASASAQGTVLQAIDGAGYTYLELEADGKRYWIAGTQVKCKKGDKVKYDENVTMQNFFSKTLQRSFDTIVFASHVTVVE